MSYWHPREEAAEKRAETTGEDTYCRNCGRVFSEHNNSKCPRK